ncbi:MAG: hypothetical protein QOI95_4438 [Acidimicrobiaceae bacterium]|jgi:hypothetical protein
MIDFRFEHELSPHLVNWLVSTKRVRVDSLVVRELPWFGRRIDLAVLTKSLRTAAYELKLSNHARAIEQAGFNRLAFDRSYVASPFMPSKRVLELAEQHALGFVLLNSTSSKVLLESPLRPIDQTLRKRLLTSLRSGAVRSDGVWSDV